MRFLLLAPLLACATLAHSGPSRAPLENEGELHVYAAVARKAAAAEIESLAAIRESGEEAPLEILSPEVSAGRRVGFGRLEPGRYAGLSLRTRKGAPQRIEALFSVAPRKATVLALHIEKGLFTAAVPPRPLLPLASFCSNEDGNDLTLFDKHAREAAAVLPTGRGPWGIAIDPVQDRAYVALSEDDQIAVVDVASAEELSRVRLNAGDSPREVALAGRFLVTANSGSNTVSVVDRAAMIEVARVPVGEQPISLLPDRRGGRIYVFNARSNSISAVDLGSRSVVSTAATDSTPLRGQIDAKGALLYVASPLSAYLTVYSLPDLSVARRVYVGLGTTALKVDPDTDLLYVANGDRRLAIFDPFSLLPIDYLDLPGAVSWMSIDAAENVLFALLPESGSVAAIQLTTKETLALFDVGEQPRVLALMGERN